MELPVYELTISDLELDRVEAIAFVDNPAIQRNWMAFKEAENNFKFQTHDEEKRIVAGPLMVADFNIYRNMDGKEFYVKFSAKTIEAIVDKFMKEKRTDSFNMMHNEEAVISGAYLQQSFIIDSTKGINTPSGFETLPDGSWFGFIKVENDDVWNDYIKTGKIKGFSVEGSFSDKTNKFNIMTKIEALLEKIEKKFFSSEEKKTEEPKAEVAMGSAKLTDGTVVKWEGELAEGSPVVLEDGSPAPDGEHTFEDGTVIAVEGGVVTAIRMPEAMETEAHAQADFNAEIEALKLQVSELKEVIANLPKPEAPKDFSTEITEVKEQVKELFEAVKVFAGEMGNADKAKDKFRKAEGIQLGGKAANLMQLMEQNRK